MQSTDGRPRTVGRPLTKRRLTVQVPPGSLGTKVTPGPKNKSLMVIGFTRENGVSAIEAAGVRVGMVMAAVNSFDVSNHPSNALIALLKSSADREKKITFDNPDAEALALLTSSKMHDMATNQKARLAAEARANAPWVESYDSVRKCLYYYNCETGEHQWEEPEQYRLAANEPIFVAVRAPILAGLPPITVTFTPVCVCVYVCLPGCSARPAPHRR